MVEWLDKIWQKLKNAGLKLKTKKCCLFSKEVPFLGNIVSAEGIRTDPAKIRDIEN